MKFQARQLIARWWSDPVGSKVIAAGIIALASFLYVAGKAALSRLSLREFLINQSWVTISIPSWTLYLAAVFAVGVPSLLLLRRRMLEPLYISIRIDQVLGPGYLRCYASVDRRRVHSLGDLIEALRHELEEHGFRDLKFPDDWDLYLTHPPRSLRLPDLTQSLTRLGIRGGSKLEISVYPWAQKKLRYA